MKAKIDRDLLRDTQKRCAIERPKATFDILDTELSGFLVRVTPNGSMAYGIRYTNKDGKQRRFSLKKNFPTTTPSAAREEARIILGRIADSGDPASDKQEKKKGRTTLGDFLRDRYTDYLVANTKGGVERAKVIESAFPTFLDKPLSEITGESIEKWRAERIKSGVSASTTNRNITALRGLFSRAVDWKVLTEHPLKSVKMLKEPSGKVRWLPREEEKRIRIELNNREERERRGRDNANKWRAERGYELLPDLRKVAFVDHLQPMVILSLNTGMRQGELFQLLWSDVDLKNATITIHDKNTKTSETRHIPLNSEALDVLKKWKKQATSVYVFPGPTGGPITTVKTAWRALLKSAKIENFRWHDMRHHFASWLVMSGVDLNTVRELLGHADIKMTLRYAHLAPEHKSAAVQKLVSKR